MYLIITLSLLVGPAAAAIDLDPTTFTNARLGIRFHAPYGWTLHRSSGYPSLLALAVADDGRSTLGLSTELLEGDRTAAGFARSNCEAMQQVGLKVQSCGPKTLVGQQVQRAQVAGGEIEIDQAYLTRGRRVFVLTLSWPRGTEPLLTLYQAIEMLKLGAPQEPGGEENLIRGIRGKRMPGMGGGKVPEGEALPELEGEQLPGSGSQPRRQEQDRDQPPRLDESPLPEGERLPATSQPASQPRRPAPPASR